MVNLSNKFDSFSTCDLDRNAIKDIRTLYQFPAMDLKMTFKNMANTIKLAKKSDKDDYMQHLRLVLLGVAAIGTIGFIIQFVFSVFRFG